LKHVRHEMRPKVDFDIGEFDLIEAVPQKKTPPSEPDEAPEEWDLEIGEFGGGAGKYPDRSRIKP
jgi:hypothetical protein